MDTGGGDYVTACTLWFGHLGPFSWEACCRTHDQLYASGAMPKAAADYLLEACVNHVLPGMGTLMFIGVTLGGWLFWWAARRKRP